MIQEVHEEHFAHNRVKHSHRTLGTSTRYPHVMRYCTSHRTFLMVKLEGKNLSVFEKVLSCFK